MSVEQGYLHALLWLKLRNTGRDSVGVAQPMEFFFQFLGIVCWEAVLAPKFFTVLSAQSRK